MRRPVGADFYAALEGATGAAIAMPLSQRIGSFHGKTSRSHASFCKPGIAIFHNVAQFTRPTAG
jgi:hypothetical protein